MIADPAELSKQAYDLFYQVIQPTLIETGAWSDDAGVALLSFAVKESLLQWRQQLGGGPARGLWQIEQDTHDWLINNVLTRPRRREYRAGLRSIIDRKLGADTPFAFDLVEHCDEYACAVARLRLLVESSPIGGTLVAQARTWKRTYNTVQGKGTVASFIDTVGQQEPGIYSRAEWVDAARFLATEPRAQEKGWA